MDHWQLESISNQRHSHRNQGSIMQMSCWSSAAINHGRLTKIQPELPLLPHGTENDEIIEFHVDFMSIRWMRRWRWFTRLATCLGFLTTPLNVANRWTSFGLKTIQIYDLIAVNSQSNRFFLKSYFIAPVDGRFQPAMKGKLTTSKRVNFQQNGWNFFSIFWLGSFFESWKNTSIEPGVKIQHFFNFSAIFLRLSDFTKMGQKNFVLFWLGSFFESWKNTSIEPGVKIQHFFNFSAIFRTISDFASTKKKKKWAKMSKWLKIFSIFWLGSFFESWKNASIEPSVKIQKISQLFRHFPPISDSETPPILTFNQRPIKSTALHQHLPGPFWESISPSWIGLGICKSSLCKLPLN